MCAWLYRTDDHRRRFRYQHQQQSRLDEEDPIEGARTFFNRPGRDDRAMAIGQQAQAPANSGTMEAVFRESPSSRPYRYDRAL